MDKTKIRPLWVLAGAYLLYLAYQQARLLFDGQTETRAQAVICVVSGVVFVAVGAWVLWREWKYARTPDSVGADALESESSADADAPEVESPADDSAQRRETEDA